MKCVVKMNGLYKMKNCSAFYRKLGIYCFDFVSDASLATVFDDSNDVQNILIHKEYYLKQYNAIELVAEEVE